MKTVMIFDFDGVVVDSLTLFEKHFSAAYFEHVGVRPSHEDFLSLFEGNLYEAIAQQGVDTEVLQAILATLKESLNKELDSLQLFSGIAEMFEQLTHCAEVYVVTSNVTSIVSSYLAKKNIQVHAVMGADVHPSKVAKIKQVQEQCGEARYYYIGDTKGDMIEGREAGARTIAVMWGWHTRGKLEEASPDYIVESPEEIVALAQPSA